MTVVLALLTATFLYGLYRLLQNFKRISVADIPGPNPESFIIGNLRQYFQSQAGEIDLKWQESYGGVVRFKGSFGEDRLLVSDPKALQYIYHTAGYNFSKQPERRELTRMLTGRGIVWAEGQEHRRQRKIMDPAFSYGEIKSYVPLTAKWKEDIFTSSGQESVFNVCTWFARSTLDAMGVAAFDYQFGTLDNDDNELGNAYANLGIEAFGNLSESDIIKQALVPYLPKYVLSYIRNQVPSRRLEQLRKAYLAGYKVAKDLIDTKSKETSTGKGNRDIMSLLVRANLSEIKETRMSEEEMIAQVRTLLLAGYETTATTLAWTMLEIARNPEVQTKLRREIRQKQQEIGARGDSEFTSNDFDSMPYLAAVLKESLRLNPVSYGMYREPVKDDILPLSKPIRTRSGKVITEIPIPKGLKIVTSINGYHRNQDAFGPNADIYDPERWISPDRVEKIASVGVYGNLLAFAGGVRSCIGWRFAVLELQAFIVELVNNFEFSLTPEARMVRREACLLMAPTIEGQVEKGNQLPLAIKIAP
ncbi:cytochrome P450 [Pholiota conissans]|uniref:Cytochrome P450 n=1 Tax=Pholiota conissans TaxID=109636 RepID=A0A9P6CZX7_9AGAR|nr:cytochrome P450 [Pholiota conissans]